jgi:hypothetical protein
LKIQSKRGSTNEEEFAWLGQGVDEGPNATTLKWSSYLGCNACLVHFDFEIQKLHFFYVFFPHKNKPNVMILLDPNMGFII